MLSISHEGKILDFNYKKHEYGYKFYIGDIFIGLLVSIKRNSWNAINHYVKLHQEGFSYVSGFGSRLQAAEYLLRLNSIGGYGRDDEERRESIKRLEARI